MSVDIVEIAKSETARLVKKVPPLQAYYGDLVQDACLVMLTAQAPGRSGGYLRMAARNRLVNHGRYYLRRGALGGALGGADVTSGDLEEQVSARSEIRELCRRTPGLTERLPDIPLAPEGPRVGAANSQSKLDEAKVRQLRALHKEGWSWGQLARRFGVTKGAVKSAALYKTWRYV
jgi:DNA-directed RNA polymerase specialized sigma24 family protein